MSVPDAPVLEQFGPRPFSFYPPILNVEHNEWMYRKSTWSEVLVVNTKTREEVWVPRRFLGEVSRIDEPVMIVGLMKELEYKAGKVWPYERRVIEMPRSAAAPHPAAEHPSAAAPGPSPLSRAETRIGLFIAAVLALAIGLTYLVVSIGRGRVEFRAVEQADLQLTAEDDYHSVVRKLGPPAEDHWREGGGERQYRALRYPQRRLTIILMGVERDQAIYLGAMNDQWKVVHSVRHAGRGDTRALLESLKRF